MVPAAPDLSSFMDEWKSWELPFTSARSSSAAGFAVVLTRDEASGDVQLADGPAEGAGHHAHAAEQAPQHHGKPAAKALHQDAAEGPWHQRIKRKQLGRKGIPWTCWIAARIPVAWSRDPEGCPSSTREPGRGYIFPDPSKGLLAMGKTPVICLGLAIKWISNFPCVGF